MRKFLHSNVIQPKGNFGLLLQLSLIVFFLAMSYSDVARGHSSSVEELLSSPGI